MCASHLGRERGGEWLILDPVEQKTCWAGEESAESASRSPSLTPGLLAVLPTAAHWADHRAPGLGVPVDSLS